MLPVRDVLKVNAQARSAKKEKHDAPRNMTQTGDKQK
jgi:hypothetical protein